MHTFKDKFQLFKFERTQRWAFALAGAFLVSGCLSDYSFTKSNLPNVQSLSVSDPLPSEPAQGITSPVPVVCNPFGTAPTGSGNQNGIQANLTYLPASSAVISAGGLNTSAFAAGTFDVVPEPTPIFLNQLNVPTVDFTQGFKDGAGGSLKDLSGNQLLEYFSLHLDTEISLNAADTEGDYKLAILSDDGAVVTLSPAGQSALTWINNDGAHANRLGCAADTIHLRPGLSVPVHVDYFQGPRYRIALILMWKKVVPGAVNSSEPECGVQRDDGYYFTQTANGPKPTVNYQGLLNRGFKPIPAANYYLPNGGVNPCLGH